ncbi:MAG TPA: type III polyketide synthase [Caulobacteraceae bacterium]
MSTAAPKHVLLQRDVAAVCQEIFGPRYEAFERLARVFGTAGIVKRHSIRPMEWFLEPRGWPERTAAYLEGAAELFVDAAKQALEASGLTADQIDTVVTVSSTGIATPSLEARAAQAMGFRSDIQRVPVFGLGCAGGVSGLAIAARLAKAEPGSKVLLVVVELCTLAFRLDQLTKANIVATALFGDGAGACVLSASDDGIAEVEAMGEHLWPNTLDIMGWEVDPQGFGVIFAQAIPPFAESHMGPALAGTLSRAGLTIPDIDRFVCHPGGVKVIQALERALSLEQGSLDHERAVLAEYGNMSAPTVLFVLERVLRDGLPRRAAMTALGPGFSASCAVLKAAA